MNAKRRNELTKLYDELKQLRERLKSIRDEEQASYDNMPEGLQTSDRRDATFDAIDNLETAHGLLEEVLEGIQAVKEES